MEELISIIRQLYAVEILEYENKNWLGGDNKSRCKEKINMLNCALGEAKRLNRGVEK